MQPKFREDKATQAASIFLKLNNGKMSYLKLIKLLYIADREALLSWGRPITFDTYVSMDNGPVLSRTYNLIIEECEPGKKSYWRDYISEPEHFSVKLFKESPIDELSEAEINLIRNVFKEYGHFSRWQLVEIVHKFPEWQDPKGSSIPIRYRKILQVGKKTHVEITAIVNELESLSYMDEFTL